MWGLRSTVLVDHLITGEETSNVGEVLESLDDTEDLGHVFRVIRLPWRSAVKGAISKGRVDVQNQVDTSSVEDRSTFVVVGRGGQVVYTNAVDLKYESVAGEFSERRPRHTPRYCIMAASRKQEAPSLRGSDEPLKPDEPPGW